MKAKRGTSELENMKAAAGSSGGFEFIVSTPSHRHSQDHRRLVRSHVTRGRPRRKAASRLPSWINQEADEESQTRQLSSTVPLSSPRLVGHDLSWIQFPEEMQPYMLEHLTRFMTVLKDELYPTEICVEPVSIETAWIGCLASDPVYLHTALFTTGAYFDDHVGRGRSPLTQFHLMKALRLLQERIAVPDDPLAIADQTIMTVVTLALTAEILDDRASVANHMEGLRRMVKLRGGIGAMKLGIHELQAKICRVDLGFVLRFGGRPAFFSEMMSWDRYLVDRKPHPDRSAIPRTEDETSTSIASLDGRLVNVWEDLRQFSNISNLAGQTGHKLPHATYSEIIISILYRLFHLSVDDCPLGDALRVGMIVFTSSVFFRWHNVKKGQDHIGEVFTGALHKLRSSPVEVPPSILLWLLMVWNMSFPSRDTEERLITWLGETIGARSLVSWDEARRVLKSIIWIDALNDPKGKEVFSKAIQRIS